MITTTVRSVALALLALLCAAPALAAAPKPKPIKTPAAPTVRLHTEYLVEVNKEGQVVRIAHGTLSKNPDFNTITYGSAFQMWIRRPDGSAVVGLYRVTFDYNPKTVKTTRHQNIVKAGGNWGNQPGLVTAVEDQQRQASGADLPSMNEIFGIHPTPAPSP